MKEYQKNTQDLPQEIRAHLQRLLSETELSDNEENLQLLLDAWAEKERLFTSQVAALGMEQAERIEAEDERGALLLTNSGSLISLFPHRENGRRFEYASISLRTDVPDLVKGDGAALAAPIERGRPLQMSSSALKKSSPIYMISVCPADTSYDEQETRIREATIFLTNGFVRINKQVTNPGSSGVDHFTKQAIVSYLAKRNDLNQKEVRQLLDDYFSMIESAMLLGEKVNLGHLGKLSVKIRPAQKARIGRNPATGEELTIPAKPPQGVPKISFSSYIKNRAAEYDFDEEEL